MCVHLLRRCSNVNISKGAKESVVLVALPITALKNYKEQLTKVLKKTTGHNELLSALKKKKNEIVSSGLRVY